MLISFRLNHRDYRMDAAPDRRLIDFLRQDMGLTSVKEGCGEGECGACTVMVDGKAVSACLMLTGQIDGREMLTVEGLSEGDTLSALQQAFVDAGAIQCGFCTPGMLMSARALLDENPHPTLEEIKVALAGNLCRCTGYKSILTAVQTAAQKERNQDR